jgi:hypothetical protein
MHHVLELLPIRSEEQDPHFGTLLARGAIEEECPFWVTQVCRPGCICLTEEDGTSLSNPWNKEHLLKFYP